MLEFNTGAFNAPDDTGGQFIDLSVRMSGESNLYSRMIPGDSQTDQGFNTGSFNAPGDYLVRYEMNFGLESAAAAINLSGTGGLNGDPGFDVFLDPVTLSGQSSGKAGFIREINMSVALSGQSGMEAAPAYYQQSYLQLDGAFAPGERIVIDASRLTITKNGANALHMLSGEFFDLNLGPNSIVYTDDAAGRNVLVRITHKDRFI